MLPTTPVPAVRIEFCECVQHNRTEVPTIVLDLAYMVSLSI